MPVALSGELPDVELAAASHRGRTRVADVGVVLPHDHLGVPELPVEVLDERVECGRHVPVAEVPGRDLGPVHLLVVLLGVTNEQRVLLGEEQVVLGDPAVPAEVGVPAATELEELRHDLVLAGQRAFVRECVAVRLTVDAEVVEARVARSGLLGFGRIHAVEVRDHRFHRGAQAVQVEADEAHPARRMPVRLVPRARPLHELDDVPVPPHPRREPPEVAQRMLGVAVVREPHHVAVHPVRVRPVGFGRDGVEAELVDQPAGDPCPLPVEVVGSVGGLTDEDEVLGPDEVQQRVVVVRRARDRVGGGRDGRARCTVGRRGHLVTLQSGRRSGNGRSEAVPGTFGPGRGRVGWNTGRT